jgi:DNA-binding HxlR family transcriptional regulator
MDKEDEDSAHDQKIDEILKKHAQLDDTCREIFLTLQAYRRLRFNELQKYLKKFGTLISNQTLIDHLKHLKKLKLISRKRGFQYASYGLTEEIDALLHIPKEDIRKWLEIFMDDEKLPKKFRSQVFDEKEYCSKLSEKELDEKVDKDINGILAHSLFELKTFINYDLQLDKPENDTAFWNFVGKPLYRMREKGIAEDCRKSEKYRDKLLEKMDTMIMELRPDKELLKEKEERTKEASKK